MAVSFCRFRRGSTAKFPVKPHIIRTIAKDALGIPSDTDSLGLFAVIWQFSSVAFCFRQFLLFPAVQRMEILY